MIYEIDIRSSNAVADDIAAWRRQTSADARQDGFYDAALHRVYKRINRTGYDLVGIARWADRNAFERKGARADGGADLYTLINQGGDLAASAPGNLIVTNPYRIDRASAERHAEMWDQSKRHMQDKDGFVNARLFAAIDADATYVFVSRAEWRSEELFMRQFAGRDFRDIVAPFESMFSICFSRVVDHVAQVEALFQPGE